MALVTVTYKAWDHNRKIVPASAQPRVGFRPLATSLANGLMTDREIWGALDPVTGSGSVQVESSDGLLYQPFMDWVIDDSAGEPTNRARESCEWEPFFPGPGGDISALTPAARLRGILYGFGDPPSHLNNVIYLDIRGPKLRIWGPLGGVI